MPDLVSSEKRAQMMAGIKNKHSKPELLVRKNLFSRGFRYTLHANNLPGKPDLVLPLYKAVIFVNGCFWHGHPCHLFKWPQSREAFWKEKILSNKSRDAKNYRLLKESGWRVLVIHECALKGKYKLDINILMDDVTSWLHDRTNNRLMIPNINPV